MNLNRLLLMAYLLLGAASANAVTLRVSDQGDVLSMDPHSQAEALQLSFDSNIYEALVGRG